MTTLAPKPDKDTLFQRIGERIRMAREDASFKQDELGKLVGQSAVTISRWETATRRPSIDDLILLAIKLNRSIAYFTEEAPPQDDAYVQLTRTARELDQRDLRELQEYAEFRRRRHLKLLLENE